MRVRFRPGFLLVTGETADEERALQTWASSYPQHAFGLMVQDPHTIRLDSLGPKVEACREPINIVWATTPAPFNLISNLAPTPFEYCGRHYGSIEAFWQGLKHPDEESRARIAPLDGLPARDAGRDAPPADVIGFESRAVRVGTFDHWSLMERACRAKFEQHDAARAALLATAPRPLTHKVRRDSRTIPGVIMAEIWMRIRRRLARAS